MKPWMLALITGNQRVLKTATFTANTVWNAPVSTTELVSASGKGSNGTASSWTVGTVPLALALKQSTNNGGYVASRGEVTNHGLGQEGAFAGSTAERTVSYVYRSFLVGPDGLTQTIDSTLSQRVRGGYTTSIGTSTGALTYDNTSTAFFRVSIEKESGGTNGTAATAFGKSFPGGIAGPAVTTTFANLPIVGGSAYSIIVPVGGTITITYYE